MRRIELPRATRAVVERLSDAGLPAFVVGGAVRDALLGRPLRDVDLLVDASLDRAGQALPEARRIGGRRPLLLLPACGDRPRIELSAPRAGASSVEQDLADRDFTLNALAWSPHGGRLLDPFGGVDDLEGRRLRALDATRTFRDDPARVLRGVRLAADLGFEIVPGTRRAMERDAWRLAEVPGERLREELDRVLALDPARPALEALRAVGALAVVLPELLRGVGVGQNRHHTDDVFTHTLRVIDGCRPDPTLRLAAALHDAAKPDTRRWQERKGDFTFLRHEVRARPHVDRVAERLRLSKAARERIAALVRHHLLFPERLETERAIRRLLGRVGPDLLDDLLELRRADYGSRESAGDRAEAWLHTEGRIRALAAREPPFELAITGEDVMTELGLAPSPEVGRWLGRARSHAIVHPDANRRDPLLAWLRAERERR